MVASAALSPAKISVTKRNDVLNATEHMRRLSSPAASLEDFVGESTAIPTADDVAVRIVPTLPGKRDGAPVDVADRRLFPLVHPATHANLTSAL